MSLKTGMGRCARDVAGPSCAEWARFMLFETFGYRILPMMPPWTHFIAHRCVGMTDLFETSAGEKNPNS